jgi:predicted RNA-binding protein YlxR (DUF448 family)
MISKPKNELIRIAGYEGAVMVDLTGKAKGRGAYLCPNGECLAKAVKRKAIQRNIKVDMTKEQTDKLLEELSGPANAKQEEGSNGYQGTRIS